MTKNSVSGLFEELIALGHVQPRENLFDLAMPTAYRSVPSRITNGTPDVPAQTGVPVDAYVGHDPHRDRS